MRILHISTRLILGGSQENTVLSCEGQGRRGHDVHLAFGPIYGPEGSLLERVQGFRTNDRRGITTHVVPHLVREVNPLSDWCALRELKRLVAELRPDIVHTHSSKAGILGRAAAWEVHARSRSPHGIGILHTIHGPPFMPVEGSPAQRVKTRISNAVYAAAERYAARRCHTIVSVADAMTKQFLARGIGSAEQYTTVYSGMETHRYLSAAPGQSRAEMRARLGLADSDIVIGTVARLAQHKGHDDLLDALAADLRAHPTWKLLWIGDGWWRQRLIEKARTLGVHAAELDKSPSPPHLHTSTPPRPTRSPAQILLTGLVPPDDVPGHIRAMDILAHPSYREGLPRTVPQALLCGVAPVAYDVDGTGEVCRDMETGRLVPLGDRAALLEALVWLIDHPQERAAMALRGREWCTERFSAPRMVEELDCVYARALDRARR
jgi:glycosyltransferase involved in cell wall biosynthesis